MSPRLCRSPDTQSQLPESHGCIAACLIFVRPWIHFLKSSAFLLKVFILLLLLLAYLFNFYETESHYVVLAGLELSMETRLALTHRDPRALPAKCWDLRSVLLMDLFLSMRQ